MSDRREERLRRDAERDAAERRKRLIGYLVAAGLVAATGVIVVLALTSETHPPKPSKREVRTLTQAAAAAKCRVQTFRSEGQEHTEKKVAYKTNPPTSGPHNPIPAEDGEYDQAPAPEAWVHSLEHGRIVIQYRPTVSAAVREKLGALFDEDRAHMLLMPNTTGMPYEVAAVAWTHSIGCPSYDDRVDAALRLFRDTYRDKAPEQVP